MSCCSFLTSVRGLRARATQFVNVGDYEGRGESTPAPFFYQNLGEAEFVVQLYMYMRLLGCVVGATAVVGFAFV